MALYHSQTQRHEINTIIDILSTCSGFAGTRDLWKPISCPNYIAQVNSVSYTQYIKPISFTGFYNFLSVLKEDKSHFDSDSLCPVMRFYTLVPIINCTNLFWIKGLLDIKSISHSAEPDKTHSAKPGQTPHTAASELIPHCLSMFADVPQNGR